ncbi:alkaline-phosphatase-like protein, partial [Radiomyces spectabilis]|uniref:alkaline-phosphatase-like protein n=1 Tax=Radiomyces spectabilis TaxID=64574 RepID=UPI00221EDCDD
MMVIQKALFLLSFTTLVSSVFGAASSDYQLKADPEGQFPRLGACPDPHACIFPPDVSQFLPGSYFDLRVELHAYDEDASKPTPPPIDEFKTAVRRGNGKWVDIDRFFDLSTPPLEHWDFNWTNSIDALYSDEHKPINVAVSSRIYRKLKFDEPGTYDVRVQYSPKQSYTVRYDVVEPKRPKKKAKNVILFISDGGNTGMITATRAIARKHTSGKFHNLLSFEDFDNLGMIITNSVDSLTTDSANSASAYSTGHKSSVNALGVYCDSSEDPFDDPKVETITELIRRRQPKKAIGIVTTANGADATPAAFVSHTRRRSTGAEIVDQIINGVSNWTDPVVPDVWLSGGAEYFTGKQTLNGKNYYDEFRKRGYTTVFNKKDLANYHDSDKLLGIFRKDNMDVWFERNIFVNNTIGNKAAPDMSGKDALGSDQPGLQDMTIKALETLKKRGGKDGFFLMSEAASVDKQLHVFDFPRAWAELIELDVTIQKTVEWLKKNGEYDDTLILFTADHAHSFDVWGTVDRERIKRENTDKGKRSTIGVYEHSGWTGFTDADGDGFPDDWAPRITLAAGTNNGPDHYEAWQMSTTGSRKPGTKDPVHGVVANIKDAAGNFGAGLKWNGNLPTDSSSGVHSMSDVYIYSNGPSSELFGKTYENWNLFFKITQAMDLQRPRNGEKPHHDHHHSHHRH